MCGIFGYVGKRSAQPILIQGLRTLEYRGYDSAGIYVHGSSPKKAVGPIDELAKILKNNITGTNGIAHTRWATHGVPSLKNAHPHCDSSEELWIVHNGIIDNWRELKEGLIQQGIMFTSDTDSEVLAKLLGMHYKDNLFETFRTCMPYLQGTYGLVAIHKEEPDCIYATRWGSPLVLGIGIDGNFLASDPSALLVQTKDVVYLDDGDMIKVTADSFYIQGLKDGKTRNKKRHIIEWDVAEVQKGGYDHFMKKEIAETADVVKNTISGRLIIDQGRVKLGGLESILPQLNSLNRLDIIGCGSAYYAGLIGSYMIENHAGLLTRPMFSHEYRYHDIPFHQNTAVLAMSQSGETADTLEAIKKAKAQNQTTIGVINVVGSSISRETHAGVYNHAGPEVAVASTKAFISQIVVLALLTIFLGRSRIMDEKTGQKIALELTKLPDILEKNSHTIEKSVVKASRWLAKYDNAMFLGRQSSFPLACEGALKLKEVAYIHAEAYPGGELKHGPLALLDKNFPVISLVPNDNVFKKMLSNLEEVHARSAPILAVTTDDVSIQDIAKHQIQVPKLHPILQPVVITFALHLLAYHVGVMRGHNVDKPRNLAKSVTVE